MPIGRPVANVRLYILDRRMELAPAGVLGEFCVAGMGVGRGYARRPDLTAAAFWPDPFGSPGDRLYRTGDLARYCDDGTIEFHGRADDQVKIRGHRIEIGEIEAQLRRHPEVKDAAAMAWPDAGSDIASLDILFRGQTERNKPEALSAFLREWLPDYMVPAVWIELSALPLNHNGKLDRKSLPQPTNLDPRTCVSGSNDAD